LEDAEDRASLPYALDGDGMRLAVRLTPRAHKNGLDGVMTGADGRPVLQLRIAAPPVDGAANKALIAFLAQELGVRKSSVDIRSGETARLKILHLAGDGPALMERMSAWIAKSKD
jgi:uncharacterized protein (TIGR00251 family)